MRSILICTSIRNSRRMRLKRRQSSRQRLRSAGYDVTEHVGGTGIVAILKNGAGPTIMLRTELDALPVEEKTGAALRQQSSRQRRCRTRRCR